MYMLSVEFAVSIYWSVSPPCVSATVIQVKSIRKQRVARSCLAVATDFISCGVVLVSKITCGLRSQLADARTALSAST